MSLTGPGTGSAPPLDSAGGLDSPVHNLKKIKFRVILCGECWGTPHGDGRYLWLDLDEQLCTVAPL